MTEQIQGPKGDKGDKGDTGAGTQGTQGNQGNQGFRGAATQGEPGLTGQDGQDGQDGHDGARGQRGKSAFRQFAVLGIFMLLTALTLGYLVQQGQDYAQKQCEFRRDAITHTNHTWQELTRIEQMPVNLGSAAAQERVKLRVQVYADAQVVVPECEQ